MHFRIRFYETIVTKNAKTAEYKSSLVDQCLLQHRRDSSTYTPSAIVSEAAQILKMRTLVL